MLVWMHAQAEGCFLQAYWAERPELFSQIGEAKGDEERSLAVLEWFIVSTFVV